MRIKRETYKDQVIEFIYREILNGHIGSNEQIKESHLSEILNISRAPIREALRELVSMGILEYRPRVGTFVVDMKPDDIYNTYVTRGVLEGFAVAESLDKLSVEDINILEGMCYEMEMCAKMNEGSKLIELGDKFHERLFEACDNKQTVTFTRMLSLKSHLLFSKYWPRIYSSDEIKERHLQIVRVIKSNNRFAVEDVIRNHYSETGKKIANIKLGESLENERE